LLGDEYQDRRSLFGAIGAIVVNQVRVRFGTGIDPTGKAWKPSGRVNTANAVIAAGKAKARNIGASLSGKTLIKSARLRGSITSLPTADDVRVGSNLIYARVHQDGAVIVPKAGKFLRFGGAGGGFIFARRVDIPRRQYLGLSTDNVTQLEKLVLRRAENILASRQAGANA
jgi:phage gpG-like protein